MLLPWGWQHACHVHPNIPVASSKASRLVAAGVFAHCSSFYGAQHATHACRFQRGLATTSSLKINISLRCNYSAHIVNVLQSRNSRSQANTGKLLGNQTTCGYRGMGHLPYLEAVPRNLACVRSTPIPYANCTIRTGPTLCSEHRSNPMFRGCVYSKRSKM